MVGCVDLDLVVVVVDEGVLVDTVAELGGEDVEEVDLDVVNLLVASKTALARRLHTFLSLPERGGAALAFLLEGPVYALSSSVGFLRCDRWDQSLLTAGYRWSPHCLRSWPDAPQMRCAWVAWCAMVSGRCRRCDVDPR